MAERRMFHTAVVEADAFLDLPLSTQVLYFHLGMQADDDGFINGPKQIARSVGCSGEDLERLVAENFLIRFDDVVVIRHWRMANSLRSDRKKELRYPEIAKKIFLDCNKIYTAKRQNGAKSLWTVRKNLLLSREISDDHGMTNDNQWYDNCQTDGSQLTDFGFPRRKEKKGKEENRKEMKRKEMNGAEPKGIEPGFRDGESEDEDLAAAADSENVLFYLKGNLGKGVVLLTQEQMNDLLEKIGLDGFDYYVEKLANFILEKHVKIKNHYATILKWWQEDRGIT